MAGFSCKTSLFIFMSIVVSLLFLSFQNFFLKGKHHYTISIINSSSNIDPCSGKYIFIQNTPTRFNQEIIKNCKLITKGTTQNMCPYILNTGFGPKVEDPEHVLMDHGWFSTNQFTLEVIFHSRVMNYRCLANDSSVASAIFVPYYAGLDASMYLWESNLTIRDASGVDFANWVAGTPEWTRMSGRDHFLIGGRISWDFRRQTNRSSDWGSNLRFLPQSNNMSMLSIESSSWSNDYAVPYPTAFHPSTEIEVAQWQDRMRLQERRYLFSFVGAPRPGDQTSIRGKLINQCLGAAALVDRQGRQQCRLLDCSPGVTNCDNPVHVMKVYQRSVFCLQPAGDSYSRRSIFDSILAGCIPVFFHPGSAYAQYLWHLPKDYTKYSVYIPVEDASHMPISNINETLLRISETRASALREEVIRLIPRIVYSDPRNSGAVKEDAFDLAINGILERIQRIRNTIKEGKDPSIGFADQDYRKFAFSTYDGYT